MTIARVKSVVRNITEKADGSAQPYISLEDVESGTGRLFTENLSIKSVEDGIAHHPHDVLFSKLRPYLAKSVLSDSYGVGSGELLALRPGPEVNARYLWYVTLSAPWIEWANAHSYGSKMPRASWEEIGQYRMWLPPLDEQRRITDFLDVEMARTQKMMRMRTRSVQLAEERFESMADELLWSSSETVSLKWLAEGISVGVVVNPSTYVEDGAPIRFFRGVDVESFSLNVDNAQTISHKSNYHLKKSILRAGDLVSVRVGDPGISAVVPECADGSNCASVLIIRRTPKMNSQLLCHVLNSRYGRRQWSELSVGAAQKQVNVSAVGNFQIPMLTRRRQEVVAERLEAARMQLARIKTLEHQQAKLVAERRDALITAAVTGQFDVATASPIA